MKLLDEIVTEEEVYNGIIDYTNKKHIVFFDTSKNDSPDVVLLVISWRCTYQYKMRFSIFKDIFFPDIDIPVILIPKKNVISGIDKDVVSSPSTTRKSFKR